MLSNNTASALVSPSAVVSVTLSDDALLALVALARAPLSPPSDTRPAKSPLPSEVAFFSLAY